MQRVHIKLITLIFAVLPLCAHGQHSIVYSQYLFNGLLINPAYAGSHVQFSASLTYRNQWVNFPGAPVTGTLGAHTSLYKGKVGVGMLATVDRIGSYSNTGLFGSYAYRIYDATRKGVFSMGISAGFNNYNADFSDLNLRAGQDLTFSGFMSELKPNFGGGVFYYNDKWFGGFSVPTILTHAEVFNGPLEQLRTPRFYYLYGGMKFPLDPGTKKIILTPSILARVQDGTPLSTDFNLSIAFEELISLGTSYRSGDGTIGYINFKLSEKFYVGYSYDWTVSDIKMYSRGTHEIMINYRTRLRSIHRDLDCPTFFSH
ncbi:MAG: type IX secretion system membrane protein PorP/SprF [Cyclobacteriaceae bacterium]